jgi:hypothetical protein
LFNEIYLFRLGCICHHAVSVLDSCLLCVLVSMFCVCYSPFHRKHCITSNTKNNTMYTNKSSAWSALLRSFAGLRFFVHCSRESKAGTCARAFVGQNAIIFVILLDFSQVFDPVLNGRDQEVVVCFLQL